MWGLLLVVVMQDTANHWSLGSRVHANAPVCARADTASTTCGTLRAVGDQGTLQRGPAGASTGYGLSWYVQYDTPPAGWSTQRYLTLDSTPVAPPPPPPPVALMAPSSVRIDSLNVRGDTAWVYPSWSVVTAATGYLLSYPLTQTNGTWANTGVRIVAGQAAHHWESNLQSMTADSVTIRACLHSTTSTQTSRDSTCSAARQWRRAGVAPPPVPPPPPPPPVATTFLQMSPQYMRLPFGGAAAVSAFPYDGTGRVTRDTIRWSVLDTALARVAPAVVSEFATVTAQRPGSTFVQARVGTVLGQFRLVVQPPLVLPPTPPPLPAVFGLRASMLSLLQCPRVTPGAVCTRGPLPVLADSDGHVIAQVTVTARFTPP